MVRRRHKRSSKTSDKIDALKAHALRRGRERYGWMISEDIDEIAGLIRRCMAGADLPIRGGNAEFSFQETHRLKHYIVTYKEQKLNVVYDSNRNCVVTFLPLPKEVA